MKNELTLRIISSIIIIPLSLFLIIKGSIFFNFFIATCFFISIYEWHKISKKKLYHVPGFIFLFISFLSVYSLRNNFNENSLIFFLFTISICISTDIGGYCFGKIFKGPKLIKISPNKTYAGMFGGYFLSIFFIIIFFKFNQKFLTYFSTEELNISTFVFLLLISSVSQIGDITISYFKRISNVKNTGKIIPGHGGVLDRIDGMIFAFPFAYIVFSYFY
tara:strand:- start:649 stop:1305 length:657 start_codon:yes stop_codon:yes gene_type:complete